MQTSCNTTSLMIFLVLLLGTTFVPFLMTWAIKFKCENRYLAFRFISRKWILAILPCIMTVYLILEEAYVDKDLKAYIIIWAIISSTMFTLGEHISTLIKQVMVIKYKDVEVKFDNDTSNGRLILNEKSSTTNKVGGCPSINDKLSRRR